ncbi:MAG: carboxypeptidase-like regulatory domain-containing protein, partial [Chitinophagaceae bacterium]
MVILLVKQIHHKVKAQNYLKGILTVCVMLLLANNLFAQATGAITGKIIDKKTGETIIGAAVKIAGTTKGIATDVDGRYALSGLTPGTYILEISYIGYSTKRITDIEVKAAAATPVDVVIEEAGQNLATVIIT